jgi:hypothetical protein
MSERDAFGSQSSYDDFRRAVKLMAKSLPPRYEPLGGNNEYAQELYLERWGPPKPLAWRPIVEGHPEFGIISNAVVMEPRNLAGLTLAQELRLDSEREALDYCLRSFPEWVRHSNWLEATKRKLGL